MSALGPVVRRNAAARGYDLSHIDDIELGARLATIPPEAVDDVVLTLLWLTYGHRGALHRVAATPHADTIRGAAA